MDQASYYICNCLLLIVRFAFLSYFSYYKLSDTDIFEVDYADNGIFGIVEGRPTKASADGYYIITEPLQRGNYTVHHKSSLICLEPGCAEPNFAQDIKYNIIAE